MTDLNLLSDTVYRDKAMKFLQDSSLPVSTTQIKGLRQIAQHQPSKVQRFAQHQKTRADKKDKQDESAFWQLVSNLCGDNAARIDWSLRIEAEKRMPEHLTKNERRSWLEKWNEDHIPVFFQRFCTHYLYRKSLKTPKSKP